MGVSVRTTMKFSPFSTLFFPPSIASMQMSTVLKYGVMIITMILSRMVDTSNPDILMKVRIGYVIAVILNALMNYYIRTIVQKTHDERKIYIVKTMLGQEMVEETTYMEKEEAMCTQAMTGALSSVAMTLGLMSYKMGMHYGMIMYIMQMPFTIYTNPLFQKHILHKELDHPWGETTEV